MGGIGSGYRLPLQLTKEMKMAMDKLVVELETPNDFPVALRVFRAGLILYGVLDVDALGSMFRRGKIDDVEAQFLVDKCLVEDFRPVTVEVKRKMETDEALNREFADVLDCWGTLKDSSKVYHLKRAKKYKHLSYAKKLLAFVNEQFQEHLRGKL